MTITSFAPLQPLAFDLIMIDPGWRFFNRSVKGEIKNPVAHYQCMSLDDIKALPVQQLAAPSCILWLWATHPMLRQAFEVLDAWRFTFVTSGVWAKRGASGKLAFGTGYALRCASEPFLIAKIGEPTFAKNVRTVVEGPRREHSRKPDQAYEAAERLAPKALRRADIFSRETRRGWESWGNEAGKFDARETCECPVERPPSAGCANPRSAMSREAVEIAHG